MNCRLMKMLNRCELRQLVADSSHAIDAQAEGQPFSVTAWWLAFIDHVAQDTWRYAVPGFEPGRSFLPFYQEEPAWGPWRALTNFYTGQLLLSGIGQAPGGADASSVHAVFAALAGLHPAPTAVELSPLSVQDAERAQRAWRAQGWATRVQPAFGNWYLPCEGLAFDDYMRQRPKHLLNTWRRKRRVFEAGGTHRLEIVQEAALVPAAMDAFEQVYRRSWKPTEASPAFIRAWAHGCAGKGWLRLGLAWVNEVPVAAQFWVIAGGRAHVFKLAYDSAHASLSAGTVLSAHMFRHSLDVDQVHEVDYLSGDDAYKRDWMTQRRQRCTVSACNLRTWRGVALGLRQALASGRNRLRGPAPDIVALAR